MTIAELVITGLCAVGLHLIGTIWWASRLTTRVDHVERWVTRHEQVEARLAALERGMAGLQESTGRIEAILMGRVGT